MKYFAAHGPMIENEKHGTYVRREDAEKNKSDAERWRKLKRIALSQDYQSATDLVDIELPEQWDRLIDDLTEMEG